MQISLKLISLWTLFKTYNPFEAERLHLLSAEQANDVPKRLERCALRLSEPGAPQLLGGHEIEQVLDTLYRHMDFLVQCRRANIKLTDLRLREALLDMIALCQSIERALHIELTDKD